MPIRRMLAASVLLAPLLVAAPANAAPTVYEAEGASLSRCVVESNHAGYTGAGFVNCDNAAGSYIEWTVNAEAAGTTNLHVRYANGTAAARPADVSVNGTVAGSPAFPGTGAWTSWSRATVPVALLAGTNVVRLTGTTANGPANIDSLTVGDDGGGPGPATDWSDEMVRSTMERFTPSGIGGDTLEPHRSGT